MSSPRAESQDEGSSTKNAKSSPEDEQFFMAMAFLASTRSKDGDRQVGACIVKEDPQVPVGLGYNGMPDGPGFKDSEMNWFKERKNEHSSMETKNDYVCHAEMNAIISAFRRQADLSQCTIYVTDSPCTECCKLIIQCGINRVVYARDFEEKVEGKDVPEEYIGIDQETGEKKFIAVKLYLDKDMAVRKEQYRVKYDIEIDPLLSSPVESSGEQSATGEFIHCKRTPSYEPEVKLERVKGGAGERVIDLSKDDFFMAIAKLASIQSTTQPKVGACLVTVDPHRAISIGYSNHPKQQAKLQICAESSAIMNAFRFHANLTSSVLYTTSPLCFHCAKIVVQSGVKTVIYSRSSSKETEKRPEAVKETFYRARVLYLEYRRQTEKTNILLDLSKKDFDISKRGTQCSDS